MPARDLQQQAPLGGREAPAALVPHTATGQPRCQGITLAGRQCTRSAKHGTYCWQHKTSSAAGGTNGHAPAVAAGTTLGSSTGTRAGSYVSSGSSRWGSNADSRAEHSTSWQAVKRPQPVRTAGNRAPSADAGGRRLGAASLEAAEQGAPSASAAATAFQRHASLDVPQGRLAAAHSSAAHARSSRSPIPDSRPALWPSSVADTPAAALAADLHCRQQAVPARHGALPPLLLGLLRLLLMLSLAPGGSTS